MDGNRYVILAFSFAMLVVVIRIAVDQARERGAWRTGAANMPRGQKWIRTMQYVVGYVMLVSFTANFWTGRQHPQATVALLGVFLAMCVIYPMLSMLGKALRRRETPRD